MAAYRSAAIVLLTLVVSCCSVQWGQAASDCSSALAGLAGCVVFLSNTSSTPDQKTCCTPLESVLTTPSSFQCLCAAQASNSGTQLYKNALGLPSACKLPINVSEANCTQSTTPSTSSSNTTSSSSPSAGFRSALPTKPVLVLAILWSFASLFA